MRQVATVSQRSKLAVAGFARLSQRRSENGASADVRWSGLFHERTTRMGDRTEEVLGPYNF
eukprot:6191844-Pleurochrysis_carterae.AAC.2